MSCRNRFGLYIMYARTLFLICRAGKSFVYKYQSSSCKYAFSYEIAYVVDKKEYRKGKNIKEKDCRFKSYAYFCQKKFVRSID